MKTFRFLALVSGFTALALGLPAQPAPTQPMPDTLELSTALRFALDNNFAIRQARERIKQQEGVVIEIRARAIPNVSASGTYQYNDKEISSYVPASDRAWTLSLTASQAIFAGGGVRSAIKSTELGRPRCSS